jgi:hypothetical protein
MPIKARKKKRPHTSMRSVSLSGKPAPSWTPDVELTNLANECFRTCVNAHAKPDLIKVYRNSATWAYGRCFISQRLITIKRDLCGNETLPTLAHEIAHLRFASHGKRHAELAAELEAWLVSRAAIAKG